MASHYNGYFYALEEITKVETGYIKGMKDDHNRVLRLYPKLDSTQSGTYEKELEEVVKMASLAIQRHQNSKWVDDSYILIGKARHYSLDWANAIQTYKYVNTNSKNPEARHQAILGLIRTFTEHQEFNNARAAADFLQKQELSEDHKKQLYLELAYLGQTQNDLDAMVRNLTAAAPFLKKKIDRPGRIYFIIGQVYQKLGFEAEAYNYYKKCLSTHPEYEVDFYARLYMAQVAEISKSRSIAVARKSFKRLLKDGKNRDFKDKIYYEMGVFEVKQKNTEQGIENYNLAIRVGTNKQVDGEAFLRMGELYYQLKNFELSQAYYDSAVSTLPADYENIEGIKKQQKILDEFVKHITTVRWQDSLLVLSKMDTASLRKQVEEAVKATLKPVASTKRKKSIRVDAEAPVATTTNPTELEIGTWYFANASAVALGQTEFARVWGTIPLEDNWRRSQRAQTRQATLTEPVAAQTNEREKTDTQPVVDPVAEALKKIKADLPDTEEKKTAALQKIEEAYYHLGDIYSLKLNEPHNAIDIYEKLLSRFPSSDYTPEVLYRLYILTKESQPDQSKQYANRLITNYPETSWAKVLVNPDYMTEVGKATARQKALYAIAYKKYSAERYDSASLLLNQAHALGTTTFTPNLQLLEILLLGKTGQKEAYRARLTAFVKETPDTIELAAFAKRLLTGAEGAPQKTEELFQRADQEPHYFVLSFATTDALEKVSTQALDAFHTRHFSDKSLTLDYVTLTPDKSATLVMEFTDRSAALQYIGQFNDRLSTMNQLKNYNFNNFVISKSNFETLKRTQALNEYLTFYKRNYQREDQ